MKRLITALFAILISAQLLLTLPQALAAVPEIEAALEWAVEIAEDNSHGYSQSNRGGPNYDCSSFVCAALMEGGIELDGLRTTLTMREALEAQGFTCYRKGEVALKRGDILLDPWCHAEFYLGEGCCVAAHRDYDGRSGDRTGKEIQVRTEAQCVYCRRSQYIYVLRLNPAVSQEETEPLQPIVLPNPVLLAQ